MKRLHRNTERKCCEFYPEDLDQIQMLKKRWKAPSFVQTLRWAVWKCLEDDKKPPTKEGE